MVSPVSSAVEAEELRVRTLGGFAVWLGGDRLPDTVWSREKARTLFQYLVTYRDRFLAKERIAGELWPDLDAERADRDFKVALNALQNALQPNRPARAPAVYVIRQGPTYGLNPDAPIHIDAAAFDAGVSAASIAAANATEQDDRAGAIDRYRQALALYRGEYLPEAIYEDWTSAERERLAALHLTAASRLARLLLAEGALVEAIAWSRRVIALDPCWEEAYRLLMEAHMAGGNRPLAVRAYQQCRQALADHLGLEPMAETTRLYERIRSQ